VAAELGGFITGQFLLKLKQDVTDMRIVNGLDFVTCAFFQVRRLLLVQPGWVCRTRPGAAPGQADFHLSLKGTYKGLLRLEFLLKPGIPDWFPSDTLDARMEQLRATLRKVEAVQQGKLASAWLCGLFDSSEEWFYPNEEMYGKQSCFWLPVNARKLPRHEEWRSRWEKLARV